MPDITERILSSVLSITQERNRKSLERVLVSTLAEIFGFDFVAIVHRVEGSKLLEPTARYPAHWQSSDFNWIQQDYGELRIHPEPKLAQCVSEGVCIDAQEGKTGRTFFPLKLEHETLGALVIEGGAVNPQSHTLIDGFLRIHANFLAVLNESEHDPLTGLLNRKSFDHRITELLEVTLLPHLSKDAVTSERRETSGEQCSWLGILDIDYFKKINDNYGHVYGDEVLLLFSNLMKTAFRSSDLLFRYGGEEFVVVLSPTSERDALNVFERFQQLLSQYKFPQVGRVTASIGMIQIRATDHGSVAFHCADQALYYAKENGRNQIANYHKLIESGQLSSHKHEGDIELF